MSERINEADVHAASEEARDLGGSTVVSLYGLNGKREHWMPGNRRKGTGPREKKAFDTEADARAFADASNFPQGDVYQCSICGKWHLSKPRRS